MESIEICTLRNPDGTRHASLHYYDTARHIGKSLPLDDGGGVGPGL